MFGKSALLVLIFTLATAFGSPVGLYGGMGPLGGLGGMGGLNGLGGMGGLNGLGGMGYGMGGVGYGLGGMGYGTLLRPGMAGGLGYVG